MSHKLSIVLVDDNEIDLMIGTRLLSRVNPAVIVNSFSSGDQLINWLKEENNVGKTEVTVFLIDIYMPHINGFVVVDKIHELFENQTSQAHCYLLSATIDFNDTRKIERSENIAGFIGKPVTVAIIEDLIKKYSE